MNKILTFIFSLVVFAPVAAFAATDITHLTLDGKTNVTVSEGDNVDAKVTYDLTSDDDAESMSWELVGSGLPKVCVNTPDRLVNGTFNAFFDIDTSGASEGTWDVEIIVFGTNGPGSNQNCTGGGDDTMTFTNRITVTNDDNSSSSSNNEEEAPSWLQAMLAQIAAMNQAVMALLSNATAPTPAPVPANLCSQIPSMWNVPSLQVFLMTHGYAQNFATVGVFPHNPTNYFGDVTQNSLYAFKAQNNCY